MLKGEEGAREVPGKGWDGRSNIEGDIWGEGEKRGKSVRLKGRGWLRVVVA